MKLLSEYPGSSMSMVASDVLRGLIRTVIYNSKITHVLESGTFEGLGSTSFVANSFPKNALPLFFITIEANWSSWRRAKTNLFSYPFVNTLWGRSVSKTKALAHIKTDPILRNHQKIKNVFIDDIINPIAFYQNEIKGRLGKKISLTQRLTWFKDKIFNYSGDNLLVKNLRKIKTFNPLIVLDSSGGIGFLEFSIVQQEMQLFPYFLLLDDINHIKHFRSLDFIRQDSSFELLGLSDEEGWLFAKHNPKH